MPLARVTSQEKTTLNTFDTFATSLCALNLFSKYIQVLYIPTHTIYTDEKKNKTSEKGGKLQQRQQIVACIK